MKYFLAYRPRTSNSPPCDHAQLSSSSNNTMQWMNESTSATEQSRQQIDKEDLLAENVGPKKYRKSK